MSFGISSETYLGILPGNPRKPFGSCFVFQISSCYSINDDDFGWIFGKTLGEVPASLFEATAGFKVSGKLLQEFIKELLDQLQDLLQQTCG